MGSSNPRHWRWVERTAIFVNFLEENRVDNCRPRISIRIVKMEHKKNKKELFAVNQLV